MRSGRLDLGQVKLGVSGATWSRQRAVTIARLAFHHVQALATREGLGSSRTIARLTTRPIRIAPGASDDEIGRAVGAEVYQALKKG